jgi:hypothetical protein
VTGPFFHIVPESSYKGKTAFIKKIFVTSPMFSSRARFKVGILKFLGQVPAERLRAAPEHQPPNPSTRKGKNSTVFYKKWKAGSFPPECLSRRINGQLVTEGGKEAG